MNKFTGPGLFPLPPPRVYIIISSFLLSLSASAQSLQVPYLVKILHY